MTQFPTKSSSGAGVGVAAGATAGAVAADYDQNSYDDKRNFS